jgi:micrococcal nuclease
MMKQTTLTLAAILGCALLALSAARPALAEGRRPADILDYTPEVGQVTQVIDGQTIQVSLEGGPTETVRYIGIDAPALNQCMGAQARNANAALMMGKRVRMESDVLNASADGSFVWRYVYRVDATMGNEEMLKGGYAQASIAPPNIKRQGSLNNLEAAARAAGAGAWSACGWKSTVVKAPGACVTITADALNTRVDHLPEIDMLHEGDCVTIFKAANLDGPEWSGQYTYHPAGTILPLTDMFLRWKDGVVAVMKDQKGQEVAHVVKHTVTRYFGNKYFQIGIDFPAPDSVQIQALIPDPGLPQMIEIQNPRTWLLQDMGNGQYKTLIDTFVYKSGDMKVIWFGDNGGLR